MKKFILSVFVMASFGFYAVWQNVGNSSNNFVASTIVATSNTIKKSPKHVAVIPTTPIVNNPPPNYSMMGNGGMMNKSIFKDGEYIGNSADSYYGYVQVKAIISGGKLVDVSIFRLSER